MTTSHFPKGKIRNCWDDSSENWAKPRKICEGKSGACKPAAAPFDAHRFGVTSSELVVYSADANARNHRISEDLLWLERRRARRAGQIQSSLHRKRHYPEPGFPLGNGNQKRTTAFALCRNQRPYARRHQRRGGRTVLDR